MNIKDLLGKFSIAVTHEDEIEIVENVEKGVSFKGFNLWVLIFAIFIASLGLNTNSTAVIIGAMLISPLMGPIIGIGFSIGIKDFDLLKRSLKNYALATGVSVVTATIYFLCTPITEAQSELLARTSPNIYDVLIALFGGLAGVVALGAKEKGNVVPGVAIATALMPPLCTAGYGIATMKWQFFLGAFYLFFINTVFIALATYLGVKYFKFSQKKYVNPAVEKKTGAYVLIIAICTFLPSIYLTFKIVQEALYVRSVNAYINDNVNFDSTKIIQTDINYEDRKIQVVILGKEVSQDSIAKAKEMIKAYSGISDSKVSIIQGSSNRPDIDVKALKSDVLSEIYDRKEETIEGLENEIAMLNEQLHARKQYEEMAKDMRKEFASLYPMVKSFSINYAVYEHSNDTVSPDTVCLVTIVQSSAISKDKMKTMQEWLKARTKSEKLELVVKN
ncbi:MAG: TIGR00341 family protein [Bacteroidaceae bacterium]|nr:TIGR00341 family protein [Bacteroidaceae bacterium]